MAPAAPHMRPTMASARCANACHNCKRRKEKCDGAIPCAKCTKRKVEWQCRSDSRARSSPGNSSRIIDSPRRRDLGFSDEKTGRIHEDITVEQSLNVGRTLGEDPGSVETNISLPRVLRLIPHSTRSLIFIGNHGNSAFLHSVRRVVQGAIGSCSLIDDPQKHRLVDGTDVTPGSWTQLNATSLTPKPEVEQGRLFFDHYLWVTNGLVNVLDQDEMGRGFQEWLNTNPEDDDDVLSAKYYLVMAIGSMSCRSSSDASAEAFFGSGRYLSMAYHMDKPSIVGVQCFVLITLFLITASRRNAACMNLGIAVHAAQALGIDQPGIAPLFRSNERQTREGLWKCLRVLDVFLNGSLGRPLATRARRLTVPEEEDGSAVLFLCCITEEILRLDYSSDRCSTGTMNQISSLHRKWSKLFPQAAAGDGIALGDTYEQTGWPNVGLAQVHNEYYVSIMLLTRYALLDMAASVSDQSKKAMESAMAENNACGESNRNNDTTFVYACVDSATHIIDGAVMLVKQGAVPKRLPFLVNAVFLAGLVLGLAVFAGLEKEFPLHETLEQTLQMLRCFADHDLVARRGLSIVSKLQTACKTHVANQGQANFRSKRELVEGLFGSVTSAASQSGSKVVRQDEKLRQDDAAFATGAAQQPDVEPSGFEQDYRSAQPSMSADANVLYAGYHTMYENVGIARQLSTALTDTSQEVSSYQPAVTDSSAIRDYPDMIRFGDAFSFLSGDAENAFGEYWPIENAFSLD